MDKLEPHDEREMRIQEILDHPLETEQNWREVAKLIDDHAAELLTSDNPN
jgi:hypothetical protein